jgi:EAL and modified HD-GYP domain-containing signal transduction protein
VDPGTAVPAGGILIARQPILNRQRQVFAYQLRLQPLPATGAPAASAGEGDRVWVALERCGLEALTLGRPAFLRMTPAQLATAAVRQAFPSGQVVVEVPNRGTEGDRADECRAIKGQGYAVALDDFRLDATTAPLVSLANYIKVDFLPSTAAETRACVSAGVRAGVKLIAKSVDASEIFEEAVREGFTYFQGQLFEERRLERGQAVRSGQLASLRLLQALADPDLSIDEIGDLVKRDAALSYRVLRLVNSAGAAQTREVTSIKHALLLVGRDTIRRWAAVAVIAGLGRQAPDEVVVMAVVRARFCELLADQAAGDDAAGEGFLIGLCSLLDVILGRSMADILDDLPLTNDVKAALFGRDNRPRRLLDCVMAYERGDWNSCLSLAGLGGIDRHILAPSYLAALRFAYDLRQP